MRVLKQNPWLPSLGVLLAAVVVGGMARADVTTDESGSIVIFPKVIADGTRDTLIQLTNTSTSLAYVHCVYVDTSTASPGTCSGTTPPLEPCNPSHPNHGDSDCINPDTGGNNGTCIVCQPFDFDVTLTALQPTEWRVSTGRNDGDQTHGFFAGAITAHPLFLGELKCFQTDDGGVPTGANALKGEALIENRTDGQISEYNGIAIKAKDTGPVGTRCVGGEFDGGGPLGSPTFCQSDSDCQHVTAGQKDGVCRIVLSLDNAQYNACPDRLYVNHYADGASDLFAGGGTVHSELTLVPCSEDLAGGTPTSFNVEIDAYTEMEQKISQSVPLTCWANLPLYDPPPGTGLDLRPSFLNGTTFVKSQVFATSHTLPGVGVLGVLEEFHDNNGEVVGTAAANLHIKDSRPSDTITLPAGQ